MDRRLEPRAGEWIDRDRRVEFRFEGTAYTGFAGDVLSSALWAHDVRVQGRSFKYHRPRSIYSLAGHDANVIVESGEHTNLRGDLLQVRDELDVRAVNTIGGVQRDRLKVTEKFSRLLPVGFYYKAFYTPRRLFPFFENQMRKVAGLGKINAHNRCPASPKDYAFCDLAVVGAGPAGLAGAIAAAEQGLDVLVVDDQRHPGGSLAWQTGSVPGGRQLLRELLDRAGAFDNIRLQSGTQASGWYTDHWIGLVDDCRLTKLRARTTLVASGACEQPAVFQHNDLPGVMLGSAAQRLIQLYSVRPFDSAVVLAANRDAYRVTLDLLDAGVAVAAVVDLRPKGETSELSVQVAATGVAIYNGHTIYSALPASNRNRVDGALICPLAADGSPVTGSATEINCDGIAVSVGWAPNVPLFYQAGGRMRYDESLHQFVPSEMPSGLFVAGRANGIYELPDQIADGRRAGLTASAYLGCFTGEVPEVPTHRGPPPSHPYPIFAHPEKKNFVDLDEDLHLADFVHAHQEGYDNIELMKRYSTLGMGPSQGKISNMNGVRILARLNDTTIDATGSTTSRPFYQPVPIGHLAGRRFHPLRRTPMHAWHVQADAEMMYAGTWLRPEYYRADGHARNECILNEARNVRNNVGVIDVGTLGKLEISGPDAVEFLERIYTGQFAKQTVGKLRYGLACDETGVIIDDGIVARLADDRFYVTATSSGAAAFFREMQRWALIFQMDVTLVNSTGHLAAMNIAGPNSREVLQSLTDVDLAGTAFPYLGVRPAVVAGVAALLIRVGFVGELGYELHVPAAQGLHVWTALCDAGQHAGIRPFGVEAQRLLRLEKGHLIVGQDTDALTTPSEADMSWAIGKNKPFFVGGRALAIQNRKPLTRRLVGLAFTADPAGPLPKECQLIINNQDIVGRITSIAPQSTLGYPLAMSFLRPDLAEPGNDVQVKVDGGRLVTAKVVKMPFYDPENARQNA